MNQQRPTRWPCSADSSRNAGPPPRSFRNAETGVSQSSTKVWTTGTRLWVWASAPTAIEHRLGVRQLQAARAQQHGQGIEHVGRLLGDPPGGLLEPAAGDLLGPLPDLLADPARSGQERGRVGALGALARARGHGALEL